MSALPCWQFVAVPSTPAGGVLRVHAPAPSGHEALFAIEPVAFVFRYAVVPSILEQRVRSGSILERAVSADDFRRISDWHVDWSATNRRPARMSPLIRRKILLDLTLLGLRDAHEDEPTSPPDRTPASIVQEAIEWFHARLPENPTVDAVASAVGVSGGHLRKLFAQVRGESPAHCFRHLRLERAEDLLQSGADKIEIVARRSGFSGASELCRCFRNCFGAPPATLVRAFPRAVSAAGF